MVVFAVLILVILVVLYFGLRHSPSELPAGAGLPGLEETDTPTGVPEGLIEKIDFDADFLKSSRFKDLKVYGEWPLETDEKGRANPFLPY